MELFQLKGIQSPGLVDIYKRGQVVLEKLTDEQAEVLWKEGFPFLTLTEKGREKFYPEQKKITIEPIKTTNKPQKRSIKPRK